MLFCLEMINCYAAVYYSNFLYFYMNTRFHFNELENLLLAAFSGIIYAVASWQGGVFAQRHGYFTSLLIGFVTLVFALMTGLRWDTIIGQVVVYGLWSVAVCFIWPALEALVCEKSGSKLSDMIGIYNVVWAATSAVAYFTTGIFLERFGMQSLFWLPLGLVLLQLVLLPVIKVVQRKENRIRCDDNNDEGVAQPQDSRRFLHMAWLANPLSYVAINTVIPLIPSLSAGLGLTTALAGIVCSVWMFGRLFAFVILWHWKGWHYRFWWLICSFMVMVACFVLLIQARSVIQLLLSQIGFGLAVGLIYYSSLYYSMHASEGKGGHGGGFHEAMIGAGLFVGPACGASAIFLIPSIRSGSIWSVSAVLVLGLGGVLWAGSGFYGVRKEKT
ncbi:MAG: MFS transporter [Chitinivibrionales bacterium]|nr:MFS transporter [Chitinivibrionales bacterium]